MNKKSSVYFYLLSIAMFFHFFWSGSSYAENNDIKLLKDTRTQLQFPSLTDTEKNEVVDELLMLFKGTYSPLDFKLKTYGKKADPIFALNELRKKSSHLNEVEFFKSIKSVYSNLHDLHSNFNLPKPYSCHIIKLPIQFNRVWDHKGNLKLVISKVEEDLRYWNQFPKLADFQIGDEIIQYDGKNIRDAIFSLSDDVETSVDAPNESSYIGHAVKRLGTRDLSRVFAPKKNEIQLRLVKNHKLQKTFQNVSVPWFTQTDLDCMGLGEAVASQTTVSSPVNWGVVSDEPTISYKVVEVPSTTFKTKKIGVIRFKNFMPQKSPYTNPVKYIELLQNIIKNDFSQTDSIVIDVRYNNGGYADYALKFLQLFTAEKINPTLQRIVSTDVASFLGGLISKASQNWGLPERFPETIVTAAKNKDRFTELLPSLSEKSLSDTPRLYFKPVYFLANSICRSACEELLSTVKLNKIGMIISEDITSAGAAAGILGNNEFYRFLLPEGEKGPFHLLPYEMEANMSWLQIFTADKGSFEGVGVRSDVVMRPHDIDDLYFDKMYERIANRFIKN